MPRNRFFSFLHIFLFMLCSTKNENEKNLLQGTSTAMKEIHGKEVDESELIPGIRYWIVPNDDSMIHSFGICSGIFQDYYRNIINLPMVRFIDAYYLGKRYNPIHQEVKYRFWHPYPSLHRFFEIRTLTKQQTKDIQTEANIRWQRRMANHLDTIFKVPRDVLVRIMSYLHTS